MPTPDSLRASEDRVKRAVNRLQWQRRLLARTTDPDMRRLAERLVATMEEIVVSTQETHELLRRRYRQTSRDDDDPPADE